jgi:ribosomal protein L24E
MKLKQNSDVACFKDSLEQAMNEHETFIKELVARGPFSLKNEGDWFRNEYDVFQYKTASEKGEYTFSTKYIVFCGRRNSFGSTKYFQIDDKSIYFFLNKKEYEIKYLKALSSKPEKAFWIPVELTHA